MLFWSFALVCIENWKLTIRSLEFIYQLSYAKNEKLIAGFAWLYIYIYITVVQGHENWSLLLWNNIILNRLLVKCRNFLKVLWTAVALSCNLLLFMHSVLSTSFVRICLKKISSLDLLQYINQLPNALKNYHYCWDITFYFFSSLSNVSKFLKKVFELTQICFCLQLFICSVFCFARFLVNKGKLSIGSDGFVQCYKN